MSSGIKNSEITIEGKLLEVDKNNYIDLTLEEEILAAYNQGLSIVTQTGAPLASYAIDRRCLRNYYDAVTNDSVQALICFSCARRFPRLQKRMKNEVTWERVLTQTCKKLAVRTSFCGLSVQNNIFSV